MSGATGFFIVLPERGLVAPATGEAGSLRALPHVEQQAGEAPAQLALGGELHPVRVVDSLSADGPKLVAMDLELGNAYAGKEGPEACRLVPLRYYQTRALRPPVMRDVVRAAGAPPAEIETLAVTVRDAATGAPVAGAQVLAFADFATQQGAPAATTDAAGQAQLFWLKSLPRIQVVEIWPPPLPTYWGVFARDVAAQGTLAFTMAAVDPAARDCVRALFPHPVFDPRAGVIVGIVDTGVASHPALRLTGGRNTVTGEDPEDFGSNGDPHGTHVAGLAGAFGVLQGTAPGVDLRSYRVFGAGQANATSFAILKGIHAGVSEGCDILNLSLGVDGPDPVLEEAIGYARDAGTLVLAAANNEPGGPVGFPAAYPDCLAISAMGRLRTFPEGAQAAADVSGERGTDPANFLAAFTSTGPEIAFIGPGVGAISTLPEALYGQMSGTSMACPVVAGCAAALLAAWGNLHAAPRDRRRSAALAQRLRDSAAALGFSTVQEGAGLPATPR